MDPCSIYKVGEKLHNELLTHANIPSYVSKMTTTCNSPPQVFVLIATKKIKKACLRTSLQQLKCFVKTHVAWYLLLPFLAKRGVPTFHYKALTVCVLESQLYWWPTIMIHPATKATVKYITKTISKENRFPNYPKTNDNWKDKECIV